MTTVHLLATLGGTGGGGDGTVTSVNGQNPVAGAVTLVKADIGLGNVDNTADSAKSFTRAQITDASTLGRSVLAAADAAAARTLISAGTSSLVIGTTAGTAADAAALATSLGLKADQSGVTTALGLKADLASPTFTGTPAAPTPTVGANTTQVATTAFVKAAIDALVNGAPGALDTLKEISDQLANDESTVSALTTAVAGKVPATRTVAGKPLSADVTLVKGDVGLGNVDNTADTAKPVSTLQQTALNLKANDNAVVHQTDSLPYVRRYSSGAWPVRGTIPSGSIVQWIGPTTPPIDGTYALTGVDTYLVTVS